MSHLPTYRSSAVKVAALCAICTTYAADRVAADIVAFTVPGSESSTLRPGLPDVSGNNVVWRAQQGSGWGVYGRNLATNTAYNVTAGGTVLSALSIGGNIVAWEDNRNNSSNIYYRDLASQQEVAVSTGGTIGGKITPRTDGQRVVWTDVRSGGGQVYSFDIQTGTEEVIANAPNEFPASTSPDVSGASIVYHDNLAVFIKNATTNLITRVGGNEALRSNPAISSNLVVHERRPNRSTFGDIYAYNVDTGEEFAVATGAASQQNPAVSDRYVVWEDARNGPINIYGFDLLTRQQFPIYTGNVTVSNPAIDGNLVVWQESYGNGLESIRGAFIPEPASVGIAMIGILISLRRCRQP